MSKLSDELYALLDAAGFYVDYRRSEESDQHRLWVAPPKVRDEMGQPSPDHIQVLEDPVLIIDITDGVISVSACRYCGGYGPGDYQNRWFSSQDAFEDVRTLLVERDIRMQAKDVGSQLHPRPSIPVEGGFAALKDSLLSKGFVINDTVIEARDTFGCENSQQPAFEANDGGIEVAFAFLHPRGFWCVRSFRHETDRWFGDFEHYWATADQVIADIDDFLRCNSLRRRALSEGIKHAASHRQ